MPLTLNERQALVKKLITNCATLAPLGEAALMAVPEDRLLQMDQAGCHTHNEQLYESPPFSQMQPGDTYEQVMVGNAAKYKLIKAKASGQTPANNGQQQPAAVTLDKLPPELQKLVGNAAKIEAQERKRLTDIIKGSGRLSYTDEQLAALPIENEGNVTGLATIAALAEVPQTHAAPSYVGQSAPAFNTGADKFNRREDTLDIPTMNFDEEAAKIHGGKRAAG